MNVKNKIVVLFLACFFIGCSNSDIKDGHTFKDDINRSYNITQTENTEKKDINEELAVLYGLDDPLGPLNRRIYYFNGMADRYVLKPVVTTYKYYTPNFVQKRFNNFFNNFQNVGYALNSFLQLKFTEGIETVARFGINITIGLLGLFDPATSMGFPVHKENLGMTMAYYGVGRGPYIVLPFMGPSNLRDSISMGVNGYAIDRLDVYHPVNIDFSDYYMLALYGFYLKEDTGIYFMDSDYVFEYEYARFLSKKYNDLVEKRNKHIFEDKKREKIKSAAEEIAESKKL